MEDLPRYDADVLIVDDHHAVRAAVSGWLAASFQGLRVQEACDAEEALKAVEATRFDLVLMDLGLPGTNGVEATRLLSARLPQTKIVVVSVHDSDAHRAAAQAAGAVAFVAKRHMHEHLRAALRQVLDALGAGKISVGRPYFETVFLPDANSLMITAAAALSTISSTRPAACSRSTTNAVG